MKLYFLAAALFAGHLAAQPSTFSVTGKQGEESVVIHNVTFELAAKTVLRKTEHTTLVVGDKGREASTLIEAWPLGVDRKEKPKYSLKVAGVDARSLDNQFLIVTRGLEDVEWWSLYRLSDGKPLFDTYVHPFRIPDSEIYAGLDVPADGDPRLKNQSLIGILATASAEGPVRRVEIHCANSTRARLLRSYFDVRRSLEFNAAKKVFVLTLHDAAPDARIEVPLTANGPIRACDTVAR